MPLDLTPFDSISEQHADAGNQLFVACNAELLPCDAMAFTILERSLNLMKGFQTIVGGGGYSCGVALLRMQLDNLLRFNGIALSRDPHETSSKVISGVRLSRLKDRMGAAMTDKRLVEVFAAKNPWVVDIYNVACSYVHLSDQHFLHFLSRSPQSPDGTRAFNIGDEEDYVSAPHKESLLNAFIVVSRGVPKIVNAWREVRGRHGTTEDLKRRYHQAV